MRARKLVRGFSNGPAHGIAQGSQLAMTPDGGHANDNAAPCANATAPASRGAAAAVSAVTSVYQGFRLASHFQPIYSLTHHRVVGHEALLRATDAATGAPVAPLDLFDSCADDDARVRLDRAALMQAPGRLQPVRRPTSGCSSTSTRARSRRRSAPPPTRWRARSRCTACGRSRW